MEAKRYSAFLNLICLAIFNFAIHRCTAQTETLSTSLCGQTSAGSPCPGDNTVQLYDFAYNITSGDPAFTAINNWTTSGTYTAADITGFTIYVTTFCAFNTSTPLQTIAASGPGSHTFNFADPLPPAPSQRYFWITTNFTAGAVPGHTIRIDLITAAMTAVTGTESFGTNTQGGLQTICNPLPIELESFGGKNIDGKNNLNWTTTSEISNDYFTLEKSANGIDFGELARIEGAGNSNAALFYEFVDPTPFPGNTYYRLKQTDFDGSVKYSATISIQGNDPSEIEIYPNPTTGSFEILSNAQKLGEVQVMSISGKLMKEINAEDKRVDISALPTGIYFVYIKIQDRTVIKRVVKQ